MILDFFDVASVIFGPFFPESFASRQLALAFNDTGSNGFSKLVYIAIAVWSHLQINQFVDLPHALMRNDTGLRAAC
jgi:hypothetical protein